MPLDTLQQAVGGDEFDERELAVPLFFLSLLVAEPLVELLFTDRVPEDEIVDPVAEDTRPRR